jgi:hypothetical protein
MENGLLSDTRGEFYKALKIGLAPRSAALFALILRRKRSSVPDSPCSEQPNADSLTVRSTSSPDDVSLQLSAVSSA